MTEAAPKDKGKAVATAKAADLRPLPKAFSRDTPNESKIPRAIFIEDMKKYVEADNDNRPVGELMAELDEQYRMYKYMEVNVLERKKRAMLQAPESQSSLDVVQFLTQQAEKDEENIKTQFPLTDNVWAKATLQQPKSVALWLGAGVMLEYSFDEATKLLTETVEGAKESISKAETDLDFLRAQIVTTEVNMTRMYNFDVHRSKAAREASQSAIASS